LAQVTAYYLLYHELWVTALLAGIRLPYSSIDNPIENRHAMLFLKFTKAKVHKANRTLLARGIAKTVNGTPDSCPDRHGKLKPAADKDSLPGRLRR